MQQKSKTYKTGLYLFTLLCSMAACGQGQVTMTNFDTNKLPDGIKSIGKFKTEVRYT